MATSSDPSDPDAIQYNDFPPALLPAVDVDCIGTFEQLLLGPEYDFGQGPVRPLVMVLRMESGSGYVSRDDQTMYDVYPGERKSVWLIHSVLIDRMRELRPKEGERVALRYLGTRRKKGAKEGEKNTDYNAWKAVCPDRPSEIQTTSWDDSDV